MYNFERQEVSTEDISYVWSSFFFFICSWFLEKCMFDRVEPLQMFRIRMKIIRGSSSLF